jgi:hypothetical protein
LENRRAEQVLSGRDWYRGRGELEGKGCRRVNMVQKQCTLIHKCKTETNRNYSRNGEREEKGEWWRG